MTHRIPLLFAAVALLLTGCSPSRPEQTLINQATLSAVGESVGTLPDGRAVHRYWVWNGSTGISARTHAIYVVAGADSVTSNRMEQVGKATVLKVESTIAPR